MKLVLDAGAVIAWLYREPGAGRLITLLADPQNEAWLHAINLTEVRYYALRRGSAALQTALGDITAARISISYRLDESTIAFAAHLKANYAPIALADTFAVALAVQLGATLISTDRGELEKIDQAGICPIEFLR